MTPATLQIRAQLQQFIESHLMPETAVKGVVVVGSVASGHARPDSDIDAVVFLDPLDLYIVPAESKWQANDDTFHSIFKDMDGLQLDLTRLDWIVWSRPDFEWEEGFKAEMSQGWIAYDRSEEVAELIQQKTIYTDAIRQQRLDEAITFLDQHLGWGSPEKNWDHLGPAIAHDRLQAAYGYLVAGLFAYNRQWRIWRNREMNGLSQLPWLPAQFDELILIAGNAPSLDQAGYQARVEALDTLFTAFQVEVQAAGLYGADPISEAFMRGAEEPGRAWNMDEWNERRQQRLTKEMV